MVYASAKHLLNISERMTNSRALKQQLSSLSLGLTVTTHSSAKRFFSERVLALKHTFVYHKQRFFATENCRFSKK
jgi:hypothetical protein